MKLYTYLALLLSFLTTTTLAQNTDGCDGFRYVYDIFDDVTTTTVKFGENYNAAGEFQELFMDVYEPQGDILSKRPAIILAFGGSFVSGSRADMAALCTTFAKKGYVAAAIDYRLWTIFGIPDTLQTIDIIMKATGDMKAAVRHLRKDADTEDLFRVDPNHLFIGGVSAGAITALSAAYIDANDDIPSHILDIIDDNGGLEGSTGDTGNQNYSSAVSGVLNLSGAILHKSWLSANDPLLMSFHGLADNVVPCEQGLIGNPIQLIAAAGSCALHERANTIGLDNYIITIPGGGHTDIYFDSLTYGNYILEFAVNSFLLLHETVCAGVTVDAHQAPTQENIPIHIAPNPAIEQIQIDLSQASKARSLSIYTPLGEHLHTIYEPTNLLTLHRQQFGRGLYILRIEFEQPNTPPAIQRIIFQ